MFQYPVHRTWEFTSAHPIRSVYPLWPVYGLPMLLLRWVWGNGEDRDQVAPVVVYWTLRMLMFILSFVLEDWAIHELVPSPRQRRVAILLVASSYVTWTYQTHTFSNSIETLLVAWSLVLIQRIVDENKVSQRGSTPRSLIENKLMEAVTLAAIRIWPACFPHGFWHLQSHHVSRLHHRSGSTAIAIFPVEVGHVRSIRQG